MADWSRHHVRKWGRPDHTRTSLVHVGTSLVHVAMRQPAQQRLAEVWCGATSRGGKAGREHRLDQARRHGGGRLQRGGGSEVGPDGGPDGESARGGSAVALLGRGAAPSTFSHVTRVLLPLRSRAPTARANWLSFSFRPPPCLPAFTAPIAEA